MDSNRWSEKQPPPNPNPSTDPYAQLYNAHHTSYAHYPSHQSQNPNTLQIPSIHHFDAILQPPDIESYAAVNSYHPPHHAVCEAQATLAYGHQSTQVGALPEANYYQDPTIVHNWAAKEAIRQFGSDPSSYAAAGIRPPNGTEPLMPVNPNPTFWINPGVRPPFNNALKRGPKKSKIVQSAWCEICKIDCNSKDVLDQHKLGKKHKKNLEKLEESKKNATTFATAMTQTIKNPVVIGPQENPSRKKRASSVPVEEDLETKRRKLVEGGAVVEAVRVCAMCNVVCNSQTVFGYHLAGQKHAAMVKKQAEDGIGRK